MLLSMYYLQDGRTRLLSLAGGCKGNVNLAQQKSKIYNVLSDMVTACEEIGFTMGAYDYIRLKEAVMDLTRVIRNTEEVDLIKTHLETFVERYLKDIDYSDASTYDFTRACNGYVVRRRNIELRDARTLSSIIRPQSRNLNILDTRCGTGEILEAFGEGFSQKTLYGIEVDQNLAKTAREHINRVAMGGIAGSRITNDSFDIMICEPPIAWNASFNGNQSAFSLKQEKKFLNDTIKYLRADGIGIILMPYYRLYKDICLFIAKNFRNVQIRRIDGDFHNYGLVAITGTRHMGKELDDSIYKMLRRTHNRENIPSFSQEDATYDIPRNILPIDTFRGSILDSEELLGIVTNSGCMQSFWKKQQVEKLSESSKQPLLPFNIGQIGLVLTSGCLDGIIDEGNGCYHIIKGKVSKQSNIERNYNSETELETQETISNRVEINVLLPNGEFKVLA